LSPREEFWYVFVISKMNGAQKVNSITIYVESQCPCY